MRHRIQCHLVKQHHETCPQCHPLTYLSTKYKCVFSTEHHIKLSPPLFYSFLLTKLINSFHRKSIDQNWITMNPKVTTYQKAGIYIMCL